MSAHLQHATPLGAYLKGRREKLDAASLGFSTARRRTPGLRREEVAQRANISPTWYTWLEQGRGGAASAEVLDRIAHALLLTDAEREHLFLLGLNRPPEVRYRKEDAVSPRLQRVLDAFDPRPAIIRNSIWDILAWNRASTLILNDYGSLPPEQRNVLRVIFLDPKVRAAQYDWHSVARFIVGNFRAEVVRAGAAAEVQPLVEELSRLSPDFKAMWADNDVHVHGDGTKQLNHPLFGPVEFEHSAFVVDGRQDLSMIVYNPVTPGLLDKIAALMSTSPADEIR